jgi:Ser/Thr protein kinase RdoA (MazF antagonist)
MYFDEAFIKENSIESCKVLHKFKSRKNDVYLVRAMNRDGSSMEYVHKIFRSDEAASKEARLLKELRKNGLYVPAVYYTDKSCLIMEYIRGSTLCDKIFDIEKAADKEEVRSEEAAGIIIHELCYWLKSFYTYVKGTDKSRLILGDVNLRNFIFDGRVCGIDFEEVKTGLVEEDIGRMCAFLLTYNPAFTPWKRRFAVSLLERLSKEINIDRSIVEAEFKKELYSIAERRGLLISRDITDGNIF